MDLEVEWDEEKRFKNLKKHQIDFLRGRMLFDSRPIYSSDSAYAGEARILTTEIVDGMFVTAVWTQRETNIRFISVR